MKATINLDESEYRIYRTKEDWDADSDSYAGYKREYDAHNYGRGRTLRYGSRLSRYQNEPDTFPCLMLIGNYMYMSDGPDEIANQFIYNFTLDDEDTL